MKLKFPTIASFKTAEAFEAHYIELSEKLGERLDCDRQILKAADSPLASALQVGDFSVGNRFCIHPMEGWDGTTDGKPTDWTIRRWRNFGLSGAKMIWGGEAVAVEHQGRANPNQLFYAPENEKGIADLREAALSAHRDQFGSADDLFFGLQITHSGRFARPNEHDTLEPRTMHDHPVLGPRHDVPQSALLTDDELDGLAEKFVKAAVAAQKIGFQFVDVKHCHGYLLHEMLAAKTREGRYGGSVENRTRFLRTVVEGIKRDAPGLAIGVRLSIYDQPPSRDWDGTIDYKWRDYHIGVDPEDPMAWDLNETIELIKICKELGVVAINATAGSPYYSAHIQRPAQYPPVDSKEPRIDPLVGVVRQIQAVRQIKRAVPEMPIVGTAYSYLQEYLPHVAQAEVRGGHVDSIGLGRVVLSYPNLPEQVFKDGAMTRQKICRTFSDCTNGPRMGFISGCFPLDPDYKQLPEWDKIRARKKELRDG